MFRLGEIAERLGCELRGDSDLVIKRLCGLSDDRPDCLSYVDGPRHIAAAQASRIPAFVTLPDCPIDGKACLLHARPAYAIALIGRLFEDTKLTQTERIDATAVIAPSATLGDAVQIGAHVVIGRDVRVGARTRIYPGTVVMDRALIGEDCIIYPRCVLREDSVLGQRVILQPGVVVGGDGFGFVQHAGENVKVPQLGHVIIEDDVEIGANSTVDRARFTETRIGRNTKIDNLVQIAHNCTIGANCIIVAQTGISGSVKLGDRVMLAGQVGVIGHLEICSDAVVLGKSVVAKSIREPGNYAGIPARPADRWRRAVLRFYAEGGRATED